MRQQIALMFLLLLFFSDILAQTDTNSIAYENNLTFKSQPTGAKIFIDSVYVGKTPKVIKECIPNNYLIQMKLNDSLKGETYLNYNGGEEELFLVLDGDYGLLDLITEPADAEVFINDSLIGVTPIFEAKVPTGIGKIKIIKNDYSEIQMNLFINKMKRKINKKLEYKYGFLNFESSVNDIRIKFDDKLLKDLPLINKKIAVGRHLIKISTSEFHKELEKSILIRPSTQNTIVTKFNYFTTEHIYQSAMLPGLGQFIDESKIKGAGYFLGFVASAYLVFSEQNNIKNNRNKFKTSQERYFAANSESDAILARSEMETYTNNANKSIDIRNISLISMIGIYIINVFDAVLFHSNGANIQIITKPIEKKQKSSTLFGIRFKF